MVLKFWVRIILHSVFYIENCSTKTSVRYRKYASCNFPFANFLLHYIICSKLLYFVQFAHMHVSRTKNYASWIFLHAFKSFALFCYLQNCRSLFRRYFGVPSLHSVSLRKIRKKKAAIKNTAATRLLGREVLWGISPLHLYLSVYFFKTLVFYFFF